MGTIIVVNLILAGVASVGWGTISVIKRRKSQRTVIAELNRMNEELERAIGEMDAERRRKAYYPESPHKVTGVCTYGSNPAYSQFVPPTPPVPMPAMLHAEKVMSIRRRIASAGMLNRSAEKTKLYEMLEEAEKEAHDFMAKNGLVLEEVMKNCK